jgi:3-deoxy-D-manno-octulosonic-acid transferase
MTIHGRLFSQAVIYFVMAVGFSRRHSGAHSPSIYNHTVYSLYSLLFLLALILSTPWWLVQMLRHGKYRTGWKERLGTPPDRLFNKVSEHTIWIHAVSVGEVLASSRTIDEIKAHLPGWRIVVSTTTDTGQKLARQRFGDNDVFYLPLDLPWAVRAYLQSLRPKMLVLAESEFWPNLLHEAHKSGVAVAVVNARVSDRSLPGYLRFRGLLQRVMQNIDVFLAQSEQDANRLVQIGASAERVHVSGNLKFEVKPHAKPAIVDTFQAALEREDIGPVIVAGSTLEGEEAMLLETFRRVTVQYPGALLVLAPRHPERFGTVASLVASSGLRWQLRSDWGGQSAIAGGVFLLDTIGELASLYEFADIAFVGGSLVPRGGHNVLEAAQFGVPILVGPSTENFRDIIEVFRHADALRVVDSKSLIPTVLQLLENDDERAALGDRALEVMRSQQGATQTTVGALLRLLATRVPNLLAEKKA